MKNSAIVPAPIREGRVQLVLTISDLQVVYSNSRPITIYIEIVQIDFLGTLTYSDLTESFNQKMNSAQQPFSPSASGMVHRYYYFLIILTSLQWTPHHSGHLLVIPMVSAMSRLQCIKHSIYVCKETSLVCGNLYYNFSCVIVNNTRRQDILEYFSKD